MRRAGPRAAALVAAAFPAFAAVAAAPEDLPHYAIQVSLDPAKHGIAADIEVTVPAALAGKTVEFLLADSVKVVSGTPAVAPVAGAAAQGFQGINGASTDLAGTSHAARYRVSLPGGARSFRLRYEGTIDYPFVTPPEEYARGFKETAGTVGPEGVYLAGSTLWYPYLGDGLFTFSLEAAVPAGWHLVSVGNGTSNDGQGDGKARARWRTDVPLDELHLVGGPLKRYTASAGAAQAEVYLHEADDALAHRYLDATARYIEMYRNLIGPYPYEKFALVENFWETGYGMPSFTLLGREIVRFPFILTSSYPHEILHNWWGNSVFVDYGTGNWCEGLTAYMADHLMKEQQGQGAEYRLDTVKRYRDYVREGRDFPLKDFRSRHSAATEAVGYGKALMGFHMLRRQLGDDVFRKALASFYRTERGQRAGFADLRREFEKAGSTDLAVFFREWVDEPGAADVRLGSAIVRREGNGWRVAGTLRQVQPGSPKHLRVPVSVRTAAGYTVETVAVSARDTAFAVKTAAEPQLIEVDPEFDVFRVLDARETAPSIGQIMGDADVLAVLPGRASAEAQAAYREMVGKWASPVQKVTVKRDDELKSLPGDRAVWVLGRENRFAASVLHSEAAIGLRVSADRVATAEGELPFADHSLVLVRRQPGNPMKAVGFIAAEPVSAAAGLARKLPHYGKYSYLGFAGGEPANVLKGEWPASDSPLRRDLRAGGASVAPLPPLARAKRTALAELPAVFSDADLLRHVQYLAAPEREGRGLGSAGNEAAAAYIEKAFRDAGLKPAGDGGGWRQAFTVEKGPDGKPVQAANVLGLLPGTNPAFAGQAVVVSAHYDHLGHGWPNPREGDAGKVHPGADDNASGVAVLIEMARALASQGGQPRTVLFAAFSGEEAGRLGSQWFVAHPAGLDLAGIRGDINFDTVGRLGAGDVKVLATSTAREWPFTFQGAGFSTGIKVQSIPGASESSDQQSFIDKGIPGVQLFTGANADYHRPSDTADKIDAAGMVKVALVAEEAITWLAARPEPLTVTIGPKAPAAAAATAGSAGGRRVSFGVVPDYAFAGPGVRAESVVEGSPVALAGLRAGDVVLSIGGKAVSDLGGLSEVLKGFSPGNTVDVQYRRDAAVLTAPVTLVAR